MDKNNLNKYNSVILSKSLKNVDTISNTTSSLMPQKGGYLDATSSFMPQKGGYLNNNKNKDINQLMSMLSATSESNYTTNSTNTEEIKNKLLNILQDGGGREYEELKVTFRLLKKYAILLNVKSLQLWKMTDHEKYQAKIFSIFNNLNLKEKTNFINYEIYRPLVENRDILTIHPILISIYSNIIANIIDDTGLNEIIKNITYDLYNEISKIIIYYLSNPPKQTDDDKYKDQTESLMLFYFYDMLTRIRNAIEGTLISNVQNSIPFSAEYIPPPPPPPPPQLQSQISELEKEIDRLEQWERNKLAQSAAASVAPTPTPTPRRYQQRR